MDDSELEYFFGTVARKKEPTPLEFSDWRKVPATTKDKISDVIKVIFLFDRYLLNSFHFLCLVFFTLH